MFYPKMVIGGVLIAILDINEQEIDKFGEA